MIVSQQSGFIRTLQGPDYDLWLPSSDAQFDEADVRDIISASNRMPLIDLLVLDLESCRRDSSPATTLRLSRRPRKAQPLLWTRHRQVETGDYSFYAALARAALWDSASADEQTGAFRRS